MIRRNLTLSNILACATLASAMVFVFSPVLATLTTQGYADGYAATCIVRAMRIAHGALAYASDNDDTLPRLDNNGSCLYADRPCDYPDWGDLRFPANGGSRAGMTVMFPGAIEPYHGNYKNAICPKLGLTNWKSALLPDAVSGLSAPNSGYVASDERYYYNTLGQLGVNVLIVDYANNSSMGMRPGAPHGRTDRVARPNQTILMAKESSWDWQNALKYRVGNVGLWPSWPNKNCWSSSAEGGTVYAHGATLGKAKFSDQRRLTRNSNLQGEAIFIFVDGHVASMGFAEAEKCVPTPRGQTWNRGARGAVQMRTYYPHWTPDL